MSKPFKFRRARLLAGLFLASCAVLLLMGILSTGGWRQFWHGRNERTFLVRTEVEEFSRAVAGANPIPVRMNRALVKGARVELLGQTIGTVEDLWLGSAQGEHWPDNEPLDERCRVIGQVKIFGDFARLVGGSSRVTLREDLAGFGGVFLEVTPGAGGLTEAGPLPIEFVPSARTKMEEVFEKLKPQVADLGALLKTLRDDIKPFFQKDGHLQKSLEGIAAAKPVMAKAEETLTGVTKAVDSYKLSEQQKKDYAATMQAVSEVMKSLNEGKIETKFPEFKRVEQEFTKTVKDLGEACRELTETMEAAQRTWLLRSKVEEMKEEKVQPATGGGTPKSSPRSSSKPSLKPR